MDARTGLLIMQQGTVNNKHSIMLFYIIVNTSVRHPSPTRLTMRIILNYILTQLVHIHIVHLTHHTICLTYLYTQHVFAYMFTNVWAVLTCVENLKKKPSFFCEWNAETLGDDEQNKYFSTAWMFFLKYFVIKMLGRYIENVIYIAGSIRVCEIMDPNGWFAYIEYLYTYPHAFKNICNMNNYYVGKMS